MDTYSVGRLSQRWADAIITLAFEDAHVIPPFSRDKNDNIDDTKIHQAQKVQKVQNIQKVQMLKQKPYRRYRRYKRYRRYRSGHG